MILLVNAIGEDYGLATQANAKAQTVRLPKPTRPLIQASFSESILDLAGHKGYSGITAIPRLFNLSIYNLKSYDCVHPFMPFF